MRARSRGRACGKQTFAIANKKKTTKKKKTLFLIPLDDEFITNVWFVCNLAEKTGLHSYSASELIAICARDPAHARLFNYASMAFNNHTFFLNLVSLLHIGRSHPPSLLPLPANLKRSHKYYHNDSNLIFLPLIFKTNQTQQVPDPMLEAIEESCSSLDSLKAEFIAIANAMFGPGFVWLVKENEFGRLRLLSTYLAGSPLSEAHVRSSSPYLSSWESHGSRTSMNSLASPGGGSAANRSTRVSSSYDNLQSSTQQQRQKRLAPNGIEITPLLCVNLWEHVWVPDYGVFGKRDYLEAWWNKIDWSSVMTQAAQHGASTPRISSMGF